VVSAQNNIDLQASATAALTTPASQVNTIMSLSASGTAVLQDNASGVNSINLQAASTAQQFNIGSMTQNVLNIACNASVILQQPASGLSTFFVIAPSSDLVVNGAACHGIANINFTATGTASQFSTASVLAELEIIVASHAKLWKSPIGYVEGEDVVYWPD
jgi:hypothetical protein